MLHMCRWIWVQRAWKVGMPQHFSVFYDLGINDEISFRSPRVLFGSSLTADHLNPHVKMSINIKPKYKECNKLQNASVNVTNASFTPHYDPLVIVGFSKDSICLCFASGSINNSATIGTSGVCCLLPAKIYARRAATQHSVVDVIIDTTSWPWEPLNWDLACERLGRTITRGHCGTIRGVWNGCAARREAGMLRLWSIYHHATTRRLGSRTGFYSGLLRCLVREWTVTRCEMQASFRDRVLHECYNRTWTIPRGRVRFIILRKTPSLVG